MAAGELRNRISGVRGVGLAPRPGREVSCPAGVEMAPNRTACAPNKPNCEGAPFALNPFLENLYAITNPLAHRQNKAKQTQFRQVPGITRWMDRMRDVATSGRPRAAPTARGVSVVRQAC
jgi:hypothetical protein